MVVFHEKEVVAGGKNGGGICFSVGRFPLQGVRKQGFLKVPSLLIGPAAKVRKLDGSSRFLGHFYEGLWVSCKSTKLAPV